MDWYDIGFVKAVDGFGAARGEKPRERKSSVSSAVRGYYDRIREEPSLACTLPFPRLVPLLRLPNERSCEIHLVRSQPWQLA